MDLTLLNKKLPVNFGILLNTDQMIPKLVPDKNIYSV
jgi:hypothetical protein